MSPDSGQRRQSETGERWAIIAAAGAGNRFGSPKQFAQLHGRSLLRIAVSLFASYDGTVVALSREMAKKAQKLRPDLAEAYVIAGGVRRRDSVARALKAIPDRASVIAVHDAARPWVSEVLLARLERALGGATPGSDVAGVIPGIEVPDTIKRVDASGAILETMERAALRAIQTPQLFAAEALRRAHDEVPDEVDAPDDAALVEAIGLRVVVIPGERTNVKVTYPEDLP